MPQNNDLLDNYLKLAQAMTEAYWAAWGVPYKGGKVFDTIGTAMKLGQEMMNRSQKVALSIGTGIMEEVSVAGAKAMMKPGGARGGFESPAEPSDQPPPSAVSRLAP